MAILVDTNVIIDVLTDDPAWAEWSIAQLEGHSDSGLVINPVVYAELCFGSPSTEFVDDVVRKFGLNYQEIPRQGLFRAAKAFGRYRTRRGTKTSPLPDFFIGGHAEAAGIPLLTRDTNRMSTYFPGVRLICPQQ
ncbi:MAG: type II toxin-antitoxin system VapC family toxin [Lentisphaerae bacterium]|nr:type II toxin-antitoxin system VapC family toxin [Lentisphaerota bacterium]